MDTLEALRLFVAIAETGSLSGAARQNAVATSTVTVALQQLEKRVGVRLITRSTRQLTLTHEGQQFLSDAYRLLADWGASIAGMQVGPLRGPIKIAAPFEFGRVYVAPIVDQFMDLHPGIEITLLLSDGVIELVESDVDVAIRFGPLVDSTLKARLLRRGTRVVCAAPEYWKARGVPTHPDALTDHNCLVHPRPAAIFATWPFSVEGKALSVRVRGNRITNDSATLLRWAIKGFGVLRRSDWGILQELKIGALVSVLNAFTTGNANIYAVTTAGLASQRVQFFIDFLNDQLPVIAAPDCLKDA